MVEGKVEIRDEKKVEYEYSLSGKTETYSITSDFTNQGRMRNYMGGKDNGSHSSLSSFSFDEEDAQLLIELLDDFMAFVKEHKQR